MDMSVLLDLSGYSPKNWWMGLMSMRTLKWEIVIVCIQAKQSHAPFSKKAEFQLKQPSELTHTGVWGPARTISLSKMRYNVIFMDDWMRHCICEQMKSKDETLSKLKQYLVMIEQQHGYTSK